jgi:FixJ family two-component response regulator
MDITTYRNKTRYNFPELSDPLRLLTPYLTEQEKNCILCAMRGSDLKQTAKEMNVDYWTICMYRKKIMKKFSIIETCGNKTIDKIVKLIEKTDFLEKLGIKQLQNRSN